MVVVIIAVYAVVVVLCGLVWSRVCLVWSRVYLEGVEGWTRPFSMKRFPEERKASISATRLNENTLRHPTFFSPSRCFFLFICLSVCLSVFLSVFLSVAWVGRLCVKHFVLTLI